MKFTMLLSLDSYFVKTFLVNKVLVCTYALLLGIVFKHLFS